ncbi:MAG: hypothetical protein PHX57_03465 [Desulfobulbaceae bacterium]|nr:hypothetical protein [Desulfobulbaceae bacterium]
MAAKDLCTRESCASSVFDAQVGSEHAAINVFTPDRKTCPDQQPIQHPVIGGEFIFKMFFNILLHRLPAFLCQRINERGAAAIHHFDFI